MKKKEKTILLLFGVPVLFCGLLIWALDSPTFNDYFWLHDRDTESKLAVAFTVALRKNHRAAYEMIDPSLKPRLDEWMKTHQPQKCARISNDILSGPSSEGSIVYYDCHIIGVGGYALVVDGLVIEKMKIVGWGETREELNFQVFFTFP